LDSITLSFKFDANFGFGAGSVNETFDILPAGNGDAFGGVFDHPTNQVVTDTARPIVGTFTIVNPTAADVAAALGGMKIQAGWNDAVGSFNDAALDFQVDVTYTPGHEPPPVPEPGTLGLVGIGLGFLARMRKQRES
jgi:hypothetical protein